MSKTRQDTETLLAGDIGGTKTNLALFKAGDDARQAVQVRTFQNDNYADFGLLLESFLAESSIQPDAVSIGVAGPVFDGAVELTNLDWHIDGRQLVGRFGFRGAWLLNDLQATARSVPLMEDDDLHELQAGKPTARGPVAVIAPGTGLGEGYLTWRGDEALAHAGEGGHADFAPRSPLQDELLAYLRKQFDHVSYERVCSGIGLPHIYNFLRVSKRGEEPYWLQAELENAEDATPVIVEAAMRAKGDAQLAQDAVELFIEVLAAEAGNLALKVGATGGVFVGGGIPPRIVSLLDGGSFVRHFNDKGRYRDYLARIPVQVMLNPEAALLGAAAYGLDALRNKTLDEGER
ncbi:MAG: glucokinase [Chloroflexi bacterium]|nr:glucokinase [Chloroflexota bacterium]